LLVAGSQSRDLVINKTHVQIEKKKGKYGIECSLASAYDGPCRHDGPCPHGWGPTLKMDFPHLRFSIFTTAIHYLIHRNGSFFGLTTLHWWEIRAFPKTRALPFGTLSQTLNKAKSRHGKSTVAGVVNNVDSLSQQSRIFTHNTTGVFTTDFVVYFMVKILKLKNV